MSFTSEDMRLLKELSAASPAISELVKDLIARLKAAEKALDIQAKAGGCHMADYWEAFDSWRKSKGEREMWR